MLITEEQVKELVNSLIDLKGENKHGFTEMEMLWRKHGIEMAIGRINYMLLKEYGRSESLKYEPTTELLTA